MDVSREVLIGLLENFGISLALVLFYGIVSPHISKLPRAAASILVGLLFGSAALASMYLAVEIQPGFFFDWRLLLIALATLYGGGWSGLTVFVLVMLYRIYMGGDGVVPGILIALLGYLVGLYFRKRYETERLTWRIFLRLGLALIAASVLPVFVLPWQEAGTLLRAAVLPVMVLTPTATMLIGMILHRETQRLGIEPILRETENRLRLAMNATTDGVWDWDCTTNRVYYSPAWGRILGENSPLPEEYSTWTTRIHPDDREETSASLASHLEGHTSVWQYQHRLRCGDGAYRWVLGRGQVTSRNNIGQPLRMVGTMVDIQGYRDAMDALAQSEAKYRALVENIDNMIARFDREKHYTYASPNHEPILGYPPDDLVGKTMRELNFSDKTCRFWDKQLDVVLESGESLHVDNDVKGKNYEWRLYPEKDDENNVVSVVAVGRDVNLLRQTERAYQTIFREMLEGFALHQLICDDQDNPVDYRFLAVNPAFETLTGLTSDDIVGKTVREVMPGIEDEWIERYGRVALTGRPAHFENYAHYLDRYFEVTAFRSGDMQFATIFTDITDRKKAVEERIELERQIQHAQKLESLGVLAGGIAHDFNNLLMGVLGYADLALSDLAPEAPARDSVVEIEKAARRAAELSKQMLAYSGRGHFVITPINIASLVEEMAHLLEVSISKTAVVKYNFAPNVPTVMADATQLRQVVMNLITNASDAIGEKSGIISITTGVMDCDHQYLGETFLDENLKEGLYVYLEVSDTGCGMSKEQQDKIFDPFYTTKFTGRGLGLAAVLGIVRGHKGAIKVYSEESRGTSFKVLLPASDEVTREANSQDGEIPDWTGAGTVLLVDDEDSVRAIGRAMLERLGFAVITAENGVDAVAVFSERHADVQAVLLDMTMPRMNGDEAFREMRRIDRNVKVILSSGYNEKEATDRFMGKGLAGFLQKPYKFSQLRAALREVLDAK